MCRIYGVFLLIKRLHKLAHLREFFPARRYASAVLAMALDRSASVTSWSSIETDERIRLTFDTEELF